MHLHRRSRAARALTRLGGPAAWVAALALQVGPAQAQGGASDGAKPSEGPAKSAYLQGVEHFKARAFADAIREFNKAYRLDPNPVLVFNMARCFEELKQYGSAIEYYRKYLEMSPNAPDRATVEDSIRTLEILQNQAATTVLVPLTVTSKPQGAKVFVDGREIGITPLKTDVPAGHHFLSVETAGHERHSSEFDATAEAPATADVVLVPRPGEPLAAPHGERGLSRRTWGFVALGLGGALAAGGGIAGWQSRKKEKKLDEVDGDPGLATESQYDELKTDGRTYALVADGLFVGGALGLGTGLVLLLTGSGGSASSAPGPASAAEAPAAGWSF